MRPSAVTGEALFTSHDGLRAEANGVLAFLMFDRTPLEMRSDQILTALLPTFSQDSAIFLQALVVEGERQRLIGLVRRISDYNNRPGIIGACVSLSEARGIPEGLLEYLNDVLFSKIVDATKHWAERPLPDRLGLLSDAPNREVVVDYRVKPGTELLHLLDASEVSLFEAIQAGFDLIELSNKIGRVVLLPKQAKGSKPADREFVASVRAASNEAETAPQSAEDAVQGLLRQEGRIAMVEKAAKFRPKAGPVEETPTKPRSMEEVLRRQRIIDQRLTRIETKLKIGMQRQKAKVMPIDQLFAGQSRKPDRQNALMLAIGAVLAIILIVLLVIWFLSPGDAIEIELQSQSESEAEAVASEHTVQTHGQETALPDDGASDMDCDDQTLNFKEVLECDDAKPQQ
jgi:hypothetical protein